MDTTLTGYIDGITPTSVAITNSEPGSGGADAETVEHAKLYIPRFPKTIQHAVTDDDYDTLASTYSDPSTGTVAKANATLRGGELNKIDVFIWTRLPDGTLTGASLALRNSLKDYLNERNVISHDIAVFSGITQAVDVEANVEYRPSRTEAEMDTLVNSVLEIFFNSDELDPGETIYLSALYDVVHNIDGVNSVIIVTPAGDAVIPSARIAVLGNVTLNFTAAELGV